MDSKEKILALKELLSKEPSELTRRKIEYLIKIWPDSKEKPLAEKITERTLNKWPSFRWKRFLGEQGESYVISHLYFRGFEEGPTNLLKGDPCFVRCKRVYISELESPWNLGYALFTGEEMFQVTSQAPKNAFGTVIVQWDASVQDGKLIKHSDEFQVKPFVINKKKFLEYKEIWKIFSFRSSDICATCVDEKYQNFSFGVLKRNLLREAIKERGEELAKELHTKVTFILKDLNDLMATPYEIDYLKEIVYKK